jgi:hypothetical protein
LLGAGLCELLADLLDLLMMLFDGLFPFLYIAFGSFLLATLVS